MQAVNRRIIVQPIPPPERRSGAIALEPEPDTIIKALVVAVAEDCEVEVKAGNHFIWYQRSNLVGISYKDSVFGNVTAIYDRDVILIEEVIKPAAQPGSYS